MSGLFDDDVSDINDRKNLNNFRPDCEISCFVCKKCKSPKLVFRAKKPHGYMFLAGEPTTSQDASGTVWVGSFKSIILPLLEKNNVDMGLVSFGFATACHGTKLQELRGREFNLALDSCSSTLKKTIEEIDPAVIIPMDYSAWDALTKDHLTGRIEKATFKEDFTYHIIPDQELRRWIAPILSPQYLNKIMTDRKKQDGYTFYARKMKKFLKEVFSMDLSNFPDYTRLASSIITCNTLEESKFALKNILENVPPLLAFDFETEGLKIEREDMNIVCVGLATNRGTYSMPFYNDDKEFKDLFTQLMTHPKIGKIAHHAKYESRCCLDKLGVCPEPWAWDSMYSSRILDNKTKCGLKPQTYIHLGIAGYDAIEDYFKAESTEEELTWGNNRRNRLMEAFNTNPAVRSKALLYVGQDALYTLELSLIQMREMSKDEHLKKGEKLFRSFINPLVRAEVNGMVVDKDQVQTNIDECNVIFAETEEIIKNDELVKQYWNESVEGHPFDYSKSSDLGHLLYDLAGLPKEYTEKGEYALDATTLERMPFAITDSILEARRIAKIRDTYLMNLNREAVLDNKTGDYLLHATYNLHVADTFRSSSSGGINLQNIPDHDERANRLIRSCIVPQKGRIIIGADYRALEVTIGCSIHHDKNMLSFLESGGDMHRASMKDIFLLSDEEADTMDKKLYKALRSSAKQSNFSAFYGAGFNSIGNTRWKDINHHPEVFAHLKKKGLDKYEDFMEHMKGVVNRLWTVQFPQYGEWREDTYEFYLRHGYVDLVDGFRCQGPLSSMQATNSPIQGPASHVLLWAFSHIDEELRQKKMQSYLVNEIHDACYGAVVPEEKEEYLKILRKWMIEEAPNKFPWVTAPLAVEAECTNLREENGNWSQENEIGMI